MKDDVSYDRVRSFERPFGLQTAPKVASRDGILRGFRPRLFPRPPWPSRDELGEDLAHLEPLDQRREATSREETMGELLYIHLQP